MRTYLGVCNVDHGYLVQGEGDDVLVLLDLRLILKSLPQTLIISQKILLVTFDPVQVVQRSWAITEIYFYWHSGPGEVNNTHCPSIKPGKPTTVLLQAYSNINPRPQALLGGIIGLG